MNEEDVRSDLAKLIEIAMHQPGIEEIQEVYGEFRKQRDALSPYFRLRILPRVTLTSNSSTS